MPRHSEGPGIWLSVRKFLLTHCLYERAAKVLARLRGCAGSPEPSLLALAISTKLAWRGPFIFNKVDMQEKELAADKKICSSGSVFSFTLQALGCRTETLGMDLSVSTLHPWRIYIIIHYHGWWRYHLIYFPHRRGEEHIVFGADTLVSASALVWHFLVCTISHEPASRF